jgi:hypothetical protein
MRLISKHGTIHPYDINECFFLYLALSFFTCQKQTLARRRLLADACIVPEGDIKYISVCKHANIDGTLHVLFSFSNYRAGSPLCQLGQGHHNSIRQLLWALLTNPPYQRSLWEETGVPGENP